MEYLRAGKWIPCSVVSELPHCYIVRYEWQGIAYHTRANSFYLRGK